MCQVKILFPPGCYGTYVGRCLYRYTDLGHSVGDNLEFDQHGSSHMDWPILKTCDKIYLGHLTPGYDIDWNGAVVIYPVVDHMLDYYNNQFIKWARGDLHAFLFTNAFKEDEFNTVLNTNWGVDFNNAPHWVLRDNFSLWINNCLLHGYDSDKYKKINAVCSLTTDDIFYDFMPQFKKLSQALGLTVISTDAVIMDNHAKFLSSQKFLGSQRRCETWVDVVLTSDQDLPSPCQTIFDEAYIQHLLRCRGYELLCYGLDVWPSSSTQLKKLIQKY